MSYKESQLDKDNKKWFDNDQTKNTLKGITISGCNIRGVFPSSLSFNYPICAIAGPNGCGKSTILALVSCAFHNNTTFFPQSKIGQKYPYYTFGDFFVFTREERGLTSSIEIKSTFLTNTPASPGKIQGEDTRRKMADGYWNHYNTRPKRKVSFLGINRILPPSESSKYKSYKNNFHSVALTNDQQELLRECMTKVFGLPYTSVEMQEHKSCKLFKANRGVMYTGFNMGAGENAVLTLLNEIIFAGEGSLIVVDEIELGIHISAQKRLINVLKELCKKFKCQIICSTHSENILDSLPPYARLLIVSTDTSTNVMTDVTTEFALHSMANVDVPELSLFVEDEVGEKFMENVLDSDLRHRVKIIQIGSADGPIPRQMAAYYRENKNSFCSFMDGDKRNKRSDHEKTMKDELGDRRHHSDDDFKTYLNARMSYLPGETWPEKYLLEKVLEQDDFSTLEDWGVDNNDIKRYCNEAISSGKHNEFYTLGQKLGMDKQLVYIDVVRFFKKNHPDEVSKINSFIHNLL